jgi:streptogrisin B
MIKKIPQWLAVLFVSTLIFALVTEGVYASSLGSIDAGVQESAIREYERLMALFPTSSETGEKKYPDYYGGSFISSEGKLVVHVTTIDPVPEAFSEVLSKDMVEYNKCDYSYSELKNIMDTINEYKIGHPGAETAEGFDQFGLFDAENRVIVFFDNLSDGAINNFKADVIDSDAIIFQQSAGPMKEEVSVDPGAELANRYSVASMGYRARRNGTDGFVTAAHFALEVGEIIDYDGVNVAMCSARQRGASVDAAFCGIINSEYTPTNMLDGTDSVLSVAISEPGVGAVVNKIGRTTGLTYGAIVSTDYTASYSDGTVLTNLTRADYLSNPGDSGGIVYMYVESSEERLTLGIHTSSNGTYACYTKADEINAALDISRY